MNTTLHILTSTTIPSIFASLGIQDSVLLLRDAVYLLLQPSQIELPTHLIYVLSEDLAARGMNINDVKIKVELIDYLRFVDLTIVHTNTVTW